MSLSKDRLLLGAVVLSESAWVYALLGAVGVAAGRSESPLSWFAIVGIFGSALLIGRYTHGITKATEVMFIITNLVGLAAIYLMVSVHVAPGHIELRWVVDAFSYHAPEGYGFVALTGSVVGLLLWVRGRILAKEDAPTKSLSFSFRVGILALGFATLVDIFNPADLNTFPMIFLFFAAGLGGLNIGHLVSETEASSKAKTWPRTIAVAVSAVLGIGLVFGIFHRGLLSFLTSPGQGALETLGKGLVLVFVAPIAYAFDFFTGGVISFFSRPYNPEPGGTGLGSESGFGDDFQLPGFDTSTLEEATEADAQGWEFLTYILHLLELAVLLLLVIGFLFLLWQLVRKMFVMTPEGARGQRESVKEEVDVGSDISDLLSNLAPNLLGFLRRRGRRSFKLPEGPPGVVEALRLYYDILTAGEANEVRRRPHETPIEFQPALEAVFPPDLVRPVTEAFNRACYGHHPSAEGAIAQMRSSLKQAKPEARPIAERDLRPKVPEASGSESEA